MKKIAICFLLGFVLTGYGFSQTANNVNITVEITNVVVNGGKVYLAIFSNAESFKKEIPEFAYDLGSGSATLTKEVSIPSGDYVISAFQDTNNNQKVDYGLFGIPKEIVGISNYSGRGFPSRDFNKQKITINSSTGKVTIGLYQF